MKDWLDEIYWNVDGLVLVIVQDYEIGCVLMMVWMNCEVLVLIVSENCVIYWLCLCGKLWCKGEEFGYVQKLYELCLDCDVDVVILMVEQVGGIVCYIGWESCFYCVFENGVWKIVDLVLKDLDVIYEYVGYYYE